MTPWPCGMLAGHPPPPPGMLTELARLRAGLPGYDVIVTWCGCTYRYEAIRRQTDSGGPWCLISTDPADLWRELRPRPDTSTPVPAPAARAP